MVTAPLLVKFGSLRAEANVFKISRVFQIKKQINILQPLASIIFTVLCIRIRSDLELFDQVGSGFGPIVPDPERTFLTRKSV
jgi:hypothetical protein